MQLKGLQEWLSCKAGSKQGIGNCLSSQLALGKDSCENFTEPVTEKPP